MGEGRRKDRREKGDVKTEGRREIACGARSEEGRVIHCVKSVASIFLVLPSVGWASFFHLTYLAG
jgi:hypothetical protein